MIVFRVIDFENPFCFLTETEIQELLSIVSSVAVKASDKNIRTRALWVISKQSFPSDVVGKMVSVFCSFPLNGNFKKESGLPASHLFFRCPVL